MNLIEKEEKIIIEQYDVVFKNFIFKMTMKINTKFFIRFKKKIEQYTYSTNKISNLLYLIPTDKIKKSPKLTFLLLFAKEKDYLIKKFYIGLKKIFFSLQKNTMIILYKKFAKIFINLSMYRVNRIEVFLNLTFKETNLKNYFIIILKTKLFNMKNSKKYLKQNLFKFIHKIQFINLIYIISEITEVKNDLKFKIKKKINRKVEIIENKSKNLISINNYKYLNIYIFTFFFFIKILNLLYVFFQNQFTVYLKSNKLLLNIGLQTIFNFSSIFHTPFLKLHKKLNSNNFSNFKKILNYFIFKIKAKIEKHVIYIWPIEQFEVRINLIILKCGHVVIFDYFKSRLKFSSYRNILKKNFIIKCPFCLVTNKNFFKFIFLT